MIFVEARIEVEDVVGNVWGKYNETFTVKDQDSIDGVVDKRVQEIVAETAQRETHLVVKVFINVRDMPEA